MADEATKIEYTPGYIYTTDSYGRRSRKSIAEILRAADIPTGLTYTQVTAITALANLVAVLVRTLIDNGVLGDTFLEEGDLSLINLVEVIENMGGDYGDPDLSGSAT